MRCSVVQRRSGGGVRAAFVCAGLWERACCVGLTAASVSRGCRHVFTVASGVCAGRRGAGVALSVMLGEGTEWGNGFTPSTKRFENAFSCVQGCLCVCVCA